MTIADLAVYDREGQLVAIAEVKNKLGTSRDWAAQLRRNVFAHSNFSGISFFLLITPDRFYLWKDLAGVHDHAAPTYEGDISPLLASYFTSSHLNPPDVSGHAFELIVAAWLTNLATSDAPRKTGSEDQAWLYESGFLDAVKNGRVEFEVAA